MDLKRREFIKLLTTTAVSIGLNPLQGIAVEDNEYLNQRIGLTCSKPSKWKFDSIADFAALRERQVLDSIIPDENHPFKDPENLPVFIMIDPNFQFGEFAPSISLWDEPLYSEVPSDEISAHQRMVEEGFASSYADVRLLEYPGFVNECDVKATDSVWKYRHVIDDGQEWHLRVRSLLIFRSPRVHTYHMVDDFKRKYIPKSVFDKFIASVKYEKFKL